jgi:hypothetical protein
VWAQAWATRSRVALREGSAWARWKPGPRTRRTSTQALQDRRRHGAHLTGRLLQSPGVLWRPGGPYSPIVLRTRNVAAPQHRARRSWTASGTYLEDVLCASRPIPRTRRRAPQASPCDGDTRRDGARTLRITDRKRRGAARTPRIAVRSLRGASRARRIASRKRRDIARTLRTAAHKRQAATRTRPIAARRLVVASHPCWIVIRALLTASRLRWSGIRTLSAASRALPISIRRSR